MYCSIISALRKLLTVHSMGLIKDVLVVGAALFWWKLGKVHGVALCCRWIVRKQLVRILVGNVNLGTVCTWAIVWCIETIVSSGIKLADVQLANKTTYWLTAIVQTLHRTA